MSLDLYDATIVAAARRGAEDRRLAAPERTGAADNPLCGDRVTIDLSLRAGRIAAIGFRARGCALCQAATAFLADTALGRGAAELRALAFEARRAVTPGEHAPIDPWIVFTPVRDHPSRRDCVMIAFEALEAALK